MKKNILILVCLLHAFMALPCAPHCQNTPQPAKENFRKNYPGALYAVWETLYNEIYAVRFIHNNQSSIAFYAADGDAIGFGKLLSPDKINSLPAAVQQTINQRFAAYTIRDVQEWVLQNKPLYCFTLAGPASKLFVGIDQAGKIKVKKVAGR